MFLRKGEYEAAPVGVMQTTGFSFRTAGAADARTAASSNRSKDKASRNDLLRAAASYPVNGGTEISIARSRQTVLYHMALAIARTSGASYPRYAARKVTLLRQEHATR